MGLLDLPPGTDAITQALPHPLDWLAICMWWPPVTVVRSIWQISSNINQLGPPWVAAYWLAVTGLWLVGEWGTDRTRNVRRGNDVLEFDPNRRGARWLGFAGSVLRYHVAAQAWAAILAELVGYGGAVALIAIGLLWHWLALIPAGYAIHRVARVHRRRVLAEAQTATPNPVELP